MTVNDAMHIGILLVDLAVDTPFRIPLWRIVIHGRGVSNIVLHKIALGGDCAGGDVPRHDEYIGLRRVACGEVTVGVQHPAAKLSQCSFRHLRFIVSY